MIDYEKIREIKNKIDGYKVKLRNEKDYKKREELKHKIKIEELKIKIKRLN
jgi:hypothetical protein